MDEIYWGVASLFAGARREGRLLYVEGNIGAGKNEVIAALRNKLTKGGKRVFSLLECVERWTHEKLIEDVFQSTGDRSSKRAFDTLGPLQDSIERQRFIREYAQDYDILIIERHPITAIEVFDADSAVRNLYKTLHLCYPFMQPAEHTLYLNASPQACFDRVLERGRIWEADIDLEMLTMLGERHDTMIEGRRLAGYNVATIDATHNNPLQIAIAACEALSL